MSFYSLKYKKPQTYTFLFVWKQTLQYPLIWIAINVFKENNFKFMSLLWCTADVKNVFLCIGNITKIEAICQLFVILGDCRFSLDLFQILVYIWFTLYLNFYYQIGPDMVCLSRPWSRPYHFKFFKSCLPQILLGPSLNTMSQILFFSIYKNLCRSRESYFYLFTSIFTVGVKTYYIFTQTHVYILI